MRADLHTHSTFSDGEMIPAELVRVAEVEGYDAIAITDHVDMTNVEFVTKNIAKVVELINSKITVIPGVEITHVPPSKMDKVISDARKLGAKWVVVHGETICEPVAPGTNHCAVMNPDVNVLAHPGFITEEDMQVAKDNDILIEISGRKGHSLTNGYVAGLARKIGAKMIVNSDTHAPNDLINEEKAYKIAIGAGLIKKEADQAIQKTPFDQIKNL